MSERRAGRSATGWRSRERLSAARRGEHRHGELDRLEQEYADVDKLPEEVDQRLGEIETALAALDERPTVYDPAEIACAGVFVSIDGEGDFRVERGYVRPDDEPPVERVDGDGQGAGARLTRFLA